MMKLLLPTSLWLLVAAAIPSFARPLEHGHDVYPRDSSYECLSEDKTLCPTGNIPRAVQPRESSAPITCKSLRRTLDKIALGHDDDKDKQMTRMVVEMKKLECSEHHNNSDAPGNCASLELSLAEVTMWSQQCGDSCPNLKEELAGLSSQLERMGCGVHEQELDASTSHDVYTTAQPLLPREDLLDQQRPDSRCSYVYNELGSFESRLAHNHTGPPRREYEPPEVNTCLAVVEFSSLSDHWSKKCYTQYPHMSLVRARSIQILNKIGCWTHETCPKSCQRFGVDLYRQIFGMHQEDHVVLDSPNIDPNDHPQALQPRDQGPPTCQWLQEHLDGVKSRLRTCRQRQHWPEWCKELEKEENADKQRLKELGCHESASHDQDGTENATTPALQPRHEHETCDSLEKQLESWEPHHNIPRAGGGESTVEKQVESILIKTPMMNCTQHPEKDQVVVTHELQPRWGFGSQSCDILESYLEKMEHGIPLETKTLCREIASLKACRKDRGCPVHPGNAQESTTHELQPRYKALGTCVSLQKQIHSWKHATIPIPPDVRQTIINHLKAQMKEMECPAQPKETCPDLQSDLKLLESGIPLESGALRRAIESINARMKEMNCLVQPTAQELQSRSLFSETCHGLEQDLKYWENKESTNVVDPVIIYGMIKETRAKMRKKECLITDDNHWDSDT